MAVSKAGQAGQPVQPLGLDALPAALPPGLAARTVLIAVVRYLQDRIVEECRARNSETMACAIDVLEDIKISLEERSAEQVERELFSA